MTTVKIINTNPRVELPKYQTIGSAGVDLHAAISEHIELHPRTRIAVPTGIFLQLPENVEAQIRPRSGLALKDGVTVLNSPGTIDSDYRGEIQVILVNHGDKIKIIEPDARIAQMIFAKYERVEFEQVIEFDKTERGTGGFGHTGK